MMEKFSISLLAIALFLFLLPTVSAQTQCGSGAIQSTGLVTSPVISGQFPTSGACIIDSKAIFAPFKIPTYFSLKSLYFDQSKANKTDATPSSGAEANQGTLRSTLNSYDVVLFRSDLRLNADLGGIPKTAVVFVEGNLNLEKNFIFGSTTTGLVFIVKGNINIDPLVTQVDATLISSGTIYTAGSDCATNSVQTAGKLTINGSLISLNQSAPDGKPIHFCRILADNSSATEAINQQPKYLVILRTIFSQPLQRWREVAGN